MVHLHTPNQLYLEERPKGHSDSPIRLSDTSDVNNNNNISKLNKNRSWDKYQCPINNMFMLYAASIIDATNVRPVFVEARIVFSVFKKNNVYVFYFIIR